MALAMEVRLGLRPKGCEERRERDIKKVGRPFRWWSTAVIGENLRALAMEFQRRREGGLRERERENEKLLEHMRENG